jgi:hypothetical protein
MPTSTTPIRVKFLAKSQPHRDYSNWLKRFPGGVPKWGRCEFVFEQDAREYDWLVVYDDLPPREGERFTMWEELLPCPRAQTLLVMTEPSTIKVYGRGYVRQFGAVLTSQEPWIVRHPGAVFSQTGLVWFYGVPTGRASYDSIVAHPPEEKDANISTVCSSKQQRRTLHRLRFEFTQKLRAAVPELDVFGHGVRFIEDKAEALDRYRYHVAIENHICRHHWTEKLSDCFLGLCLPLYHGCPNVADYFPEESFIPIDITDFPSALETIMKTVRDREYEKRLPALREARRLVLEQYSLFPLVSGLIEERTPGGPARISPADTPETILSRHAWRRRSPLHALSFGLEKAAVSLRHLFANQ